MNSKSIITTEIVIGLGYGDEGKGITTDYLCSQHPNNTCVVRFSGGQQAGHTVMLDDKKHIHSSFGSGTLRGIPSYFTEHTTFYPVTLLREYNILKSKGVHTPTLILHPMAKMTTPFDVWANKSDKINCGHGTCGLGVGKTMERNLGPLKIYAIDLLDTNGLMNKIEIIGKTYNHTNKDSNEFMNDLNEFLDSIKLLKAFIKIEGYNHLLKYNHLVFEGSQGIMLDMDHGTFPFVTYANTTSKNAHEVLDKLEIENRHLYYITRAYATRHGNGPFDSSPLKLKNNEEEINTFNKWQLEFKTGLINYNKLMFALKVDGIYSQQYPHSLVVTCLDQINIPFEYHKLGHSFHKILESHSPFSKDFKTKTL